jgi:hypothetical protein
MWPDGGHLVLTVEEHTQPLLTVVPDDDVGVAVRR